VEIIRYLQNVIFTPQITAPEVEYFQTRRLRISSEEEVPVELDGELVGQCPVQFEINARRLRVLVPS
jgi:diacylglycerol kinase (ATP)